MTITVDLPPEVEAKIKTQALNNGLTLEDYVKSLIEEATNRREGAKNNSQKNFREILEPVHKHFEESGMSEEEMMQMFEQAREEVWSENQTPNERGKIEGRFFDCMVFLQAVISEKSVAFKLFEYLEEEVFSLFISTETLVEVKDVLSRPYIRAKNPNITDDLVNEFLNRVLEKSVLLNKIPPHFSYSRDPKDVKYISLAVEVEADFIISRDRDLLDLMTGYDAESKEFRQRFRPLKVIEPIEFLKIVQEK